jgi:hypothetical protein
VPPGSRKWDGRGPLGAVDKHVPMTRADSSPNTSTQEGSSIVLNTTAAATWNRSLVKELLSQYQSQEQDLPYFNDVTSFVDEYIKSGKQTFQYRCVTFGSETTLTLDIVSVLEWLSIYHSSKSAYLFYQNQSSDLYISMIRSYSLNAILYLAAQKYGKYATSTTESDVALAALFSSFAFPSAFLAVTEHLLRFLENEKQKDMSRIKPRLGNYGRDNVMILLTEVLRYEGQSELADEVDSFCTEEEEPLFRSGVQIALSKNTAEFNRYVGKLLSFHIANSKLSDHTCPFHKAIWQFFPVEVLALFHIRRSSGIDADIHEDPIVDIFLPFISYPSNHQLDAFTKSLFERTSCYT